MNTKFGKFFKKLSTEEISCFQYDINQNYYKLIREKQKEGFSQFIITSDLMIEIMQYFILKGNMNIISIEFMSEDEEVENEIVNILKLMEGNLAYWIELREKILFLSEKNCIEVKKVDFRNCIGGAYIFSIQVNGIIIAPKDKFNYIVKSISELIEKNVE